MVKFHMDGTMGRKLILYYFKQLFQIGTHEQLKKQKGFYWSLIKQQDQDEAKDNL